MVIKIKTQVQPFALEVSKALIFRKLGRYVRVKTVKEMSRFLNPSVGITKQPFPTLEEWARLTNLCMIILLSQPLLWNGDHLQYRG